MLSSYRTLLNNSVTSEAEPSPDVSLPLCGFRLNRGMIITGITNIIIISKGAKVNSPVKVAGGRIVSHMPYFAIRKMSRRMNWMRARENWTAGKYLI